jgi:hypothetical protein
MTDEVEETRDGEYDPIIWLDYIGRVAQFQAVSKFGQGSAGTVVGVLEAVLDTGTYVVLTVAGKEYSADYDTPFSVR